MRHIDMGKDASRANHSAGSGRFTRTLATPAAVLLATGTCTAALATWDESPGSTAQVLEGPRSEPTGSARTSSESATEASIEPEAEAVAKTSSGSEDIGAAKLMAADAVPLSSFNGSSTSVGSLRVVVETAYTDPTVTDGMGSHATAPSGMTYYIYRLKVTNQGSSPAIFDTYGTRGFTPDGTSYANDIEAEVTVAWDYYWDEINPGTTVTTHIMFLLPEGTELSYLRVSGQSELHPS